jgi:RNA polymerase sigma factor (sigma-70 family)
MPNMPRLTDEQRVLAEEHMGLIGHTLQRYYRHLHPDDQADSWQYGFIGLCRATQLFEPEQGYRFSTYAVQWIRHAIQRGHLADQGCNARRAQRASSAYVPPLSLDMSGLHDDSDLTLMDSLADRSVDVEGHALAAVQLNEVVRRVDDICRDDVDRAVLIRLINSETLERAAERAGCSRETLRKHEPEVQRRARRRAS